MERCGYFPLGMGYSALFYCVNVVQSGSLERRKVGFQIFMGSRALTFLFQKVSRMWLLSPRLSASNTVVAIRGSFTNNGYGYYCGSFRTIRS